MATDLIFDALQAMEGVDVTRRIKPSGFAALSTGSATVGEVLVARTSFERGADLQATAGPGVIVERNRQLLHFGDLTPQFAGVPDGLPPVGMTGVTVQIKVVNQQDQPLTKAKIMLFGRGFPAQSETNEQGVAEVAVLGGAITSLQALYVKPYDNYWEKWIWRPQLDPSSANNVVLEPLSAFPPAHFPAQPFIGWGQRLMGLGVQTQANLRGQGARVAIADSGCDNTHPSLSHIQIGRDFTNLDKDGNPDAQSWATDLMSHGTHCAGVLAGNGDGILGFAPAAEVHILKLFPGGAFDSLISCLKYAIDNKIDVLNCSLGSDQSSELVQHWMEQARQAGVAVVVAAGNSANSVQFPGSLPNVLCVSAMGKQGEYPDDTYHAQTVPAVATGVIGVNGVFAAKFTCFGPEVKVCGPGVAVISSVPGGGYAAFDGTSMAAPHLSGLATLFAAHPAFANLPRGPARVDRLFQAVMTAAVSFGLNPLYGGAGLPTMRTIAPQPTSSTVNLDNIIKQVVATVLGNLSTVA
jgi:subtilisin